MTGNGDNRRKFTAEQKVRIVKEALTTDLSGSAVYSILSKQNLLGRWISQSGISAEKEYQYKPTRVHEHWHTDIAYVKVRGVFYFLIMMLDGYSRYVLD